MLDLYRPTAYIEVRPATGEDVKYLAARLRHQDVAEIVAASGLEPVIALGQGFVESEQCWTVTYRGEPCCMFGVVESPHVQWARFGRVWLLGTEKVQLWSLTFHKLTAAWLRKMSEGYTILGNVVDERQTDHLRWLKRVGFHQIARHDQYGHLGLPFVELVAFTEELNGV
jgi:hypothetical protein